MIKCQLTSFSTGSPIPSALASLHVPWRVPTWTESSSLAYISSFSRAQCKHGRTCPCQADGRARSRPLTKHSWNHSNRVRNRIKLNSKQTRNSLRIVVGFLSHHVVRDELHILLIFSRYILDEAWQVGHVEFAWHFLIDFVGLFMFNWKRPLSEGRAAANKFWGWKGLREIERERENFSVREKNCEEKKNIKSRNELKSSIQSTIAAGTK